MPAYVNYRGEEIGLISHPQPPKPKKDPEAFHKGWRVVGVSPAAIASARPVRQKDWDADAWAMNAKREPVRSKPYSTKSAADACAELATRGGWLRVEIVEIKQGEAPKRLPITMKRIA